LLLKIKDSCLFSGNELVFLNFFARGINQPIKWKLFRAC